MKLVIIILALATIAFAAPAHKKDKENKEKKPTPKITLYKFEQQLDGSYILQVEQDDGIIREEKGILKIIKDAKGEDHPVIVVFGKVQYTNEDGTVDVRTYGADEGGSKVEGDSVPKAPPAADEEEAASPPQRRTSPVRNEPTVEEEDEE